MDKKYLIINPYDNVFELFDSKEKAETAALNAVNAVEEEVFIYKVEQIGVAFIPDPTPIIDWTED